MNFAEELRKLAYEKNQRQRTDVNNDSYIVNGHVSNIMCSCKKEAEQGRRSIAYPFSCYTKKQIVINVAKKLRKKGCLVIMEEYPIRYGETLSLEEEQANRIIEVWGSKHQRESLTNKLDQIVGTGYTLTISW